MDVYIRYKYSFIVYCVLYNTNISGGNSKTGNIYWPKWFFDSDLLRLTQMEEEYRYKEITEKIIGTAYTVHNELGYGFLEKVYKNALIIEIRSAGLIIVFCKYFFPIIAK